MTKELINIKNNLDRFDFKNNKKYCAKCKHSISSPLNPIIRTDCTIYDYKGIWFMNEAICYLNPEIEEKYEEGVY